VVHHYGSRIAAGYLSRKPVVVATRDHAICPNLERFMAAQAHAHTVQVSGPHLIMFTNPGPVTSLIEQAATATTGS
jgi:hypothetical protein